MGRNKDLLNEIWSVFHNVMIYLYWVWSKLLLSLSVDLQKKKSKLISELSCDHSDIREKNVIHSLRGFHIHKNCILNFKEPNFFASISFVWSFSDLFQHKSRFFLKIIYLKMLSWEKKKDSRVVKDNKV
jgi:hypothetical protein